MELPKEIVGVIREFSSPVFRHWGVLNEAKTVLDSRYFGVLRKKLSGVNGDKVSEALKTYIKDLKELKRCGGYFCLFEYSDCVVAGCVWGSEELDVIERVMKEHMKEATYREVVLCADGFDGFEYYEYVFET